MEMEMNRAVARVVAAQIAEASGFDACQDSAIEVLADLLLRYVSTLCASSHSYAELAGRNQFNLADVLLSLEDLGVTADDLQQHMQLQGSDVPFAHTLAPYPVGLQRPMPPTFADQREPHPAHIPPFLPAFPDAHTYQHTAAYAGHEGDPHKQRQSMLEAKQKAEAALTKLHQRMQGSKAALPDSNPFLEPPVIEQLPAQAPPGADAVPPNGVAPAAAAAAAAAPAAAPAVPAAAPAAADGQQQQQQQQQLQQGGPLDEDALFEQAAVFKAFSSVLPADVVARQLGGDGHGQQEQQEELPGVVEEQPMDVDGASGWLGWKQQQQQLLLPPEQQQQQGGGGGELLRFGVDPLAAGKRAAVALAGRHRPADAYAARGKSAAAAGGGGSRQRKSRYDADPRVVQAEGILGAGPEAALGGGLHSVFDTGEMLDLE